MPILENMETISEFASLFRKDYATMNEEGESLQQYLEKYVNTGDIEHKGYHPLADMLSGIADITIVKPVIECVTGKDMITGEHLTEYDLTWKKIGIIIDLFTLGQGSLAIEGADTFLDGLKLAGKTFALDAISTTASYGAAYIGTELGLSEENILLLSLLTGCTVSVVGGKVLLKDSGGTTKTLSNEQVDEILKGSTGSVEEVIESGSNTDVFDYYMDLVETLDVSTEPNTATFYSGPGNRALAEEFAKVNGMVTLETTPGGAYLDELKLFEVGSPLTKEEATNVWARLSARYAQNASGNTYGFVNGSWSESIFNTVEYPEILKNPHVTNIFTEFMN